MKQFLSLWLFLGFLLVSEPALACPLVKEKKTCCSSRSADTKKIASDKSKSISKSTRCCVPKSTEQPCSGCDTDCNYGSCTCATTCSSSPVSAINTSLFDDPWILSTSFKKGAITRNTPSVSDGFTSIWLLPKIS